MSSPPSPPDPIVLPANATLAVAEALLPRVQAAAAAEGPVVVDAGEVTALGQAVVQLLLAAARSAGGIHLVRRSMAFDERIDQLGLTELAQ